ncbi:MAG: ABC transporter permease [Candidatus Verstraetearchaeota archaeon]|nr:ABC transporter permease [Candidatus Verstraetearchaeota archaeon]
MKMNAISNIFAMMELELRRIRHDRTELYTRAIQPALWIVIFGPVMGALKAIPTGGIPYTDYMTPGIIVQSMTFVSIFYGLTMVWERESGILKKLLVTPMSRYAIVVGRSMSSGLRSIFQLFIIVPIALVMGVRIIANPFWLLCAVALIFIASGGFAATSVLIASFMKSRERFMGIGQVITMPLFFASNALYPVDIMPPVLRELSAVNPMSYVVDAVRGLMITGNLSQLPLDAAAIILFDVAMFILASISFKRIIE